MWGRGLRGAARAGLVAAVMGSVLVGFAVRAGAAGGEQGVLRVKGPGSVYQGSQGFVTLAAAPGATATYAFQVKNTGAQTAQYNLKITPSTTTCTCTPTDTVTTGSVIASKLVVGPNGYYTPPIDPGKLATFAVKVTVPKTAAVPGDYVEQNLWLYDTAGLTLDHEYFGTMVTLAKGSTAADQIISASGTTSTTGRPGVPTVVTAPSIAVGGSATYTVKLQNDSPSPAAITYRLLPAAFGCGQFFSTTVKAGATDVTGLALAGTYVTPVRAPGQATTLVVTVKNIASAAGCLTTGYNIWYGNATVGSTVSTDGYLVVGLAAQN